MSADPLRQVITDAVESVIVAGVVADATTDAVLAGLTRTASREGNIVSAEQITKLERSLDNAREACDRLKDVWANQRNVDGYREIIGIEERLRRERQRIPYLRYHDPSPVEKGTS